MVKFDIFNLSNDAITTDVAGRWIETGGWSAILSGRWHATQNWPNTLRPTLLRGLRVDRFQATFALYRTNSAPSAELKFIFNAADQDSYDYIRIYHIDAGAAPHGYTRPDGKISTLLAGTRTNANVPAVGNTDPLWVRITNNGTTVTVRCATTEAGLATALDCYSSTAFNARGGMIGLASGMYYPEIDDLKVYADRDHNGSYETLEHEEHFTLDGDNTTTETLTHDLAGNLTYDGIYQYGYDAWNRMVKLTKSYRDGGGALHNGSVLSTMRYDGAGRRIEKAMQDSADLDCTYEYYYDRQSLIEARNGSSQVIQQYVWGLDYIDELIQVANNSDPTTDNTCETSYWACIDANYNVSRLIGVIGLDENSQPVYGTVERYEYTPYGQRTVFFSAGSNDPGCYAPTLISRRVTDGTTTQPYGICPIGHQGLYLDEESGIIRDRARDYKPDWGRFMQPDPLDYIDGPNRYQYVRSNPVIWLDPEGTVLFAFDGTLNREADHTNVRQMYDRYTDGDKTKFYFPGIGADPSGGDNHFLLQAATGSSGGGIVGDAFKKLDKYANGPVPANETRLDRLDRIDVVGFSRGAALAVDFANEIWEGKGIPIRAGGDRTDNRGNRVCERYKPIVRFVGLFDMVPSFGLDAINFSGQGFDNLNLGWTLDNDHMRIKWLAHARRKNDGRFGFNTYHIRANAEREFDMSHWDIGTRPEPLDWMIDQARGQGIQFSDN